MHGFCTCHPAVVSFTTIREWEHHQRCRPPAAVIEHGTANGYNAPCRCRRCLAWRKGQRHDSYLRGKRGWRRAA